MLRRHNCSQLPIRKWSIRKTKTLFAISWSLTLGIGRQLLRHWRIRGLKVSDDILFPKDLRGRWDLALPWRDSHPRRRWQQLTRSTSRNTFSGNHLARLHVDEERSVRQERGRPHVQYHLLWKKSWVDGARLTAPIFLQNWREKNALKESDGPGSPLRYLVENISPHSNSLKMFTAWSIKRWLFYM